MSQLKSELFNKKNILPKILLLILAIWLSIALLRTFYNFTKLVTEEREWYYLSDEEKRAKQYGDIHYFLRFIQDNTKPSSNIIFITDNPKAYFLSRYYWYPTKRVGYFEDFLWDNKMLIYDYYVIYPSNHKHLNDIVNKRKDIKNFKKIATYKGMNGEIGELYKK